MHNQCVWCARSAKDMVAEVEKMARRKTKEVLELLYLDKDNRLVCPRCKSERDLWLSHEGKPVIMYEQGTRNYLINVKKVDKAKKELVVEGRGQVQPFVR